MNANDAMQEAAVTVLDFESTGSVPGFKDEPWQIGMVTLRNGRLDPASMFESLLRVDANRPFNAYAPGRHHLLRDEIAEASLMNELWPQMGPRLTSCPLAAHNVATEKRFTRLAAPMHRFGPWIDTLKIARKAWPGFPSYALEELIAALDLKSRVDAFCPGKKAHDALYDAVASAMLLEHLLAQSGWGNVTVGELASM
ncbi:MAG: 3'-5' exonuclease [Kiritimatiellales bacterium]|nr:3'-5' exonuclease [Kiritimatiellales bacterium]